MELDGIAIFFRWLHIITACGVVGSAFFFYSVLPSCTEGLDATVQETVYVRARRRFKMIVHVSLLLILISGVYNAIRNWPVYTTNPPIMHGLFGMHALLGVAGLTVLMIMLAGREPHASRRGWTRWALLALILGVAVASTLKSAREWAIGQSRSSVPTIAHPLTR